MSEGQSRKSYEQSCRELQDGGLLDSGEVPPLPARRPRHDDPEPLGVSFFRTSVSGDLSNMTLPRTYFGKSEVIEASFQNTDLSESTLCWNDFVDVDFRQSCLRGSDMRAGTFQNVCFTECDLGDADLRRSTFKNCDFSAANMHGAKLTRPQMAGLDLSQDQLIAVSWQLTDGEEPGGG